MESCRLLCVLLLAHAPLLAVTVATNKQLDKGPRLAQHNQSVGIPTLGGSKLERKVSDAVPRAQYSQHGPAILLEHAVVQQQQPQHNKHSEGHLRKVAMLEHKLVKSTKKIHHVPHKLFDVLLVALFIALFCMMECGEKKPIQNNL